MEASKANLLRIHCGEMSMMQKIYNPDRTLKNAVLVIRSRKNKPPVLSCRSCPQGVSPYDNKYRKAAWACSAAISLLVVLLILIYAKEIRCLLGFTTSIDLKRMIFSIILSVIYCLIILPVSALLTLRVSRWIPAKPSR